LGYYVAGLIMGSYGIMQIALRLPLGITVDKYKIDGKLLVACGFITAIISATLLALTHHFLSIFLGRLLAGVTAAMWVIITIWYSSSFETKQSLKAMGQLQSTTVASQFISMALSGWIVKLLGYTSLFWIGELFAIIGLLLVIFLPGTGSIDRMEKKLADKRDEPAVTQILKERKLWSLSVLSMLAHAALFATIFGFSPVYLNSINSHSLANMLLLISFMLPHTLAPLLLAKKKVSLPKPFFVKFFCFGIAAGSLFMLCYTNIWIIYCLLHAILDFSLVLYFLFY
jgi:MFS family permease